MIWTLMNDWLIIVNLTVALTNGYMLRLEQS